MAIGGPSGFDNPCHECNGTGEIEGEFHYSCLGTGYTSGLAVKIFLKKLHDDTMDKCNDIKEKVDEIMAKLNE